MTPASRSAQPLSMPMLRRPYDRRRDVRTRRPFVQSDKDRHLMIEIPLPLASHRRLFSPLAYRQSGRTLFERGIRSPNQRQNRPKRIPATAVGRPFHPRIRHKLDQPRIQDLGADSLRSSNPHRSCERRQRPFLNAVSSLGGFRTPASPCLAPPRARGRRPKPFTIADVRPCRGSAQLADIET